jgi:Ca2+-binding RTX toxin-like protein
MRKGRFALAFVVAIASLVATAAPASAQDLEVNNFFSGGAGEAGWADEPTPPPGSFENRGIRLHVPTYDSFAGVDLTGMEGEAPPATAPSFDFYSNQGGSSGGSPRLVVRFSDGGSADLRPLTRTADTWTTVDGSGTNWDNNGGTCGFQFGIDWDAVVACHAGATVTDVDVIVDTFDPLPLPLTVFVDNIQYDGETIYTDIECGEKQITQAAGNVTGTSGDDVIVADNGNDVINGGDGNDRICGGGGNDRILGGAGDDQLFGGEGDDNVNGESGNDRVFGQAGNDQVFGASGNDIVFGNQGDDRLNGGAGNDVMNGGPGNDQIEGSTGDDTLSGSDGDDNLDGGTNFDACDGGIGTNVLTRCETTVGPPV